MDDFQAAANLTRVPEDEKPRPASPSLAHEQWPLPSLQTIDKDTPKQRCQGNLAAYFASMPWRFLEYENSSSPPSRRSSSKTRRRSRNISSITPLHQTTIRVQTPSMPRNMQGHEDNVSTGPCALGEGGSSLPRAMKNERDFAARATSVTASSGIQVSSMRQQPASVEVPDDGSDDYMDEDEFSIWIAQQHQEETRRLSKNIGSKATTRRKLPVIVPRNPLITYPFESLNEYTYNHVKLSPKSYVELQDKDFMRIVHIVRDASTSEVTIRGYMYRRTREMNGLLDRKLNEVCWILHIDDDDPREPLVQGVEIRAVSEVVKRRNIRLTNMAFPALSFRDEVPETEETVTNHRVLVCRYKYLCFYPNAKARSIYAWCEKGLHRIRADECDKRADNNMADDDLRHAWRGDTQPGGAEVGWLNGEKEFLRQEAISHKGSVSRQSLVASNGLEFPVGNLMKRGNVGSILHKADLSRELPASARPANRHSAFSVNTFRFRETTSDSDELEELISPRVHALQHRRGHGQRCSPRSAFNRSVMDASEYGLAEGTGMFDLSKALRESAIEAPKARQKIPQVVAQIKASASTGVSKKIYECKLTSPFLICPATKRKRSVKESDGLSTRRLRRPSPESQAMLDQSTCLRGGKGGYSRGISPSDSEETVGHSQSEENVQELRAPPKSRGTTATNSGLPISLSLGSNDAIKSSIYTKHLDAMLSRKRNLDYDMDVDDVVDLTAPPAHASSNFLSELRQPSVPRGFESVSSRSNVPQNHSKASSSPHILARTMPARQSHSSSLHRTSNPMRLQSRPSSPRPHLLPRMNTLNQFSERSNQTPAPGRQIPTKSGTTSPSKAEQRRYTFGDCFCGAGGMSRGAINAGLRIKWGFDFNQMACQTYAMNFFGTPVYQVWANEFADGKGDYKCDICHLSPPCQFFSDAHTVQGKDDDMNTASLFSIFNLLEKAKPRVVTLEQTSGLVRRHPFFFNAMINTFTSRGFSVHWRVINCADFGLPQRRMRLFIIASCPGEVLPPFPKPTHSATPATTGLKPRTTINDAIASIPPGWPNHDVHLAKTRSVAPTTGDTIASCITTNGGPGNVHPSGKRDYTHREYGCLQGFEWGHKFSGSGVKRQIGNAAPPIVATPVLEEVKRCLMRSDGLL